MCWSVWRVPPRVPQRHPAAAGGRTLPLQAGTGFFFVWRLTAAPSNRFRPFQIASGVYLAFLRAGPHGLGHIRTDVPWHRHRMGLRDGRANRHRQRPLEHPPPAALLARRILRPRASCGWSAWVMIAHGVSKFCRPIHGPWRGRSRGHCNGDHARYVRDARSVRLKMELVRNDVSPPRVANVCAGRRLERRFYHHPLL